MTDLEHVERALRSAPRPVTTTELADELGRGADWIRKQLRILQRHGRLVRTDVVKTTVANRSMTVVGYQLKKKGK